MYILLTILPLSFVGYVRPIVGSIPSIAEIQARWVCRVISGQVELAGFDKRVKVRKKDQMFWNDYFKGTSQRISTLVEGYIYVDDVANISKCYPDYWSLLRSNPKDFFAAYLAPFNGCSFLLNEEAKKEETLKTLKRHSSQITKQLNLIIIILFRLLLFYWFCDM